MRVATYRVPQGADDETAGELAVFHFGPGDGGGIEANIERWVGQFSDVPAGSIERSELRSASGLQQHVIEIPKGTFASGMPGGPTTPKTNYGLLGAIVESPSGSFFFKLTGPTATLQKERSRFFELLDSVRASQ